MTAYIIASQISIFPWEGQEECVCNALWDGERGKGAKNNGRKGINSHLIGILMYV